MRMAGETGSAAWLRGRSGEASGDGTGGSERLGTGAACDERTADDLAADGEGGPPLEATRDEGGEGEGHGGRRLNVEERERA